jgi:glycerophosphoryl diester phosphodiesterase
VVASYSRRFSFLDHPGPIPFAHRGGASEAPENTWAAFEHARSLGYRYLETDVRATADGVVVAIHDAVLDRVAGRPGRVASLTWREMASARIAGTEPVPRLDELLAAWPEARWNIDAKDERVVRPLAEVLRRANALERVCVTSFFDHRVTALRSELGPAVCASLGTAMVARLRLASILPWARLDGALAPFGAAQVPRSWRGLPLVDARFLEAAHRAGLQVHVWTIDEPPAMQRLLDLGVDGIMTDRPTVLKRVLEGRGQWV